MKLKSLQNKMSIVIKGEINIKQTGRVKKIQNTKAKSSLRPSALSLNASTTNNL